MTRYLPLFVILLMVSTAAQQPSPAPPKPPAAPAAPAPPVPPAPPAPDSGKPINIRLDVSVIDQTGTGVSQPKTLMVILRNGATGRTRAAFEDRSIFVDAKPILIDGRIHVDLTVSSEPVTNAPPKDQTLNWRNGFSLILENGRPMIAIETSDAATKRKMSMEVKATIQK
ncbi:MAG TPA: hypothetical protein VJM31_13085 [Vicinamibacterales bacterium]|nr:hypothetical protein [Vicinamibacterales bacterium]